MVFEGKADRKGQEGSSEPDSRATNSANTVSEDIPEDEPTDHERANATHEAALDDDDRGSTTL